MTTQIAANTVAQPVYMLPPHDFSDFKIGRSFDPIVRVAALASPDPEDNDHPVPPVTGTDHVYFLPTFDRTLLKIGRSIDPLERIAGLVRIYAEIDLTRAVIVAVDSPRIEAALHAIFSHRREILPVRTDGYTEWFSGDCLDEALGLLDTIASHRGAQYRVFRSVDGLVADYLAQHPNAGQRAPRLSAVERGARAAQAKVRMREAAIEHARCLCDRIAESDFDSLVRCGGNAYLARTVDRETAPECWCPQTGHHGSIWGRRFAQGSMADIEVDGGRCLFHMLNPPVFGAVDETHGREYFRICQCRPDEYGDPTPDLFSPAAFAELWRVLDELPVIELPGEWPDLPEPGVKGLK